MSRNEIAKGLKSCREAKQFSVKQVVDKLKEKGINISEKTLYGWESGRRQPDADELMILCDIYSVDDVLSAFGYKDIDNMTESELETAFEKEMKEAEEIFNQLSPEKQKTALEFLKFLIKS